MSMISNPVVSVIMPAFNAGNFIDEAIESILNQTFEDFEFIIVDDASNDSTYSISRVYAEADQRIILIRNKVNIGYRESLNVAANCARGKYIARMDADDISHPKRLELQFGFLNIHEDVGVLGTGAYIIDRNGNINNFRHMPAKHQLIMWLMCFTSPLIHPSVMMRKEIFDSVGGYDSQVVAEDYDLWWRMSHKTELANIEVKLLYLRKHGENLTIVDFQRYQESGIVIARDVVSSLLGEEFCLEKISRLWQQKDLITAEALEVGELLKRLSDTASYGADQSERSIIRQDAAKRLFRLLRLQGFSPRVWSLGFLALRISPIAGMQLLLNRISGRDTFKCKILRSGP